MRSCLLARVAVRGLALAAICPVLAAAAAAQLETAAKQLPEVTVTSKKPLAKRKTSSQAEQAPASTDSEGSLTQQTQGDGNAVERRAQTTPASVTAVTRQKLDDAALNVVLG